LHLDHQVQVAFYVIALRAWADALRITDLTFDHVGAVWLPVAADRLDDVKSISREFVRIVPFNLSLITPMVEEYLFQKLPALLMKPVRDLDWHLNPFCSVCEFTDVCRKDSLDQRHLSLIPNMSHSDYRWLKVFMLLYFSLSFLMLFRGEIAI
jgi:hypothetical protein